MKFDTYLDALAHLRQLDEPVRTLEVSPVRISTELFGRIHKRVRTMTYTQMDVWSHDLRRESSSVLGHIISGQSKDDQEWHAFVNPAAIADYVTRDARKLIDPETGRAFTFTEVSGAREVDVEVTEFFGTRESVLQLIAGERTSIITALEQNPDMEYSPVEMTEVVINRLISRINEGK